MINYSGSGPSMPQQFIQPTGGQGENIGGLSYSAVELSAIRERIAREPLQSILQGFDTQLKAVAARSDEQIKAASTRLQPQIDAVYSRLQQAGEEVKQAQLALNRADSSWKRAEATANLQDLQQRASVIEGELEVLRRQEAQDREAVIQAVEQEIQRVLDALYRLRNVLYNDFNQAVQTLAQEQGGYRTRQQAMFDAGRGQAAYSFRKTLYDDMVRRGDVQGANQLYPEFAGAWR